MKFRAVAEDPQCIQELKHLMQMLGKLSKECVLDISAQRLVFIVNEESTSTAPLVWMEVDVHAYFTQFRMEGVTAEHPHIVLTLTMANLVFALSVLRPTARYCKMKLESLQFPCLTIQSDAPSQQEEHSAWKRMHTVPVQIVPRSEWPIYKAPQLPRCQLVVNLPATRVVRGLIDKLKNLAPTTTFYAISNGELNLVAETDMATVTTRYRGLEVRVIEREPDDAGNKYVAASCVVDGKKMALFFAALQVPASAVSCGIADDRCIHLQVDVRSGVVIHSIIPAVCL